MWKRLGLGLGMVTLGLRLVSRLLVRLLGVCLSLRLCWCLRIRLRLLTLALTLTLRLRLCAGG